MTAPAINESAYSAIAMMARNARTVNAVINFLRRPRPEGNASVAVFPCAVSVVFADMPYTPFSLRFRICYYADSRKRTFVEVSQAQNHPFVGNDRNAFFSHAIAREIVSSRERNVRLHRSSSPPPSSTRRSRSTLQGGGSWVFQV